MITQHGGLHHHELHLPDLAHVRGWKRAALHVAFLALMLALCAASACAQRVSRVRAVLFYSPTCPHCHRVMTVDLPPLLERYGERLQLLSVSTATPAGRELYHAFLRRYQVPGGRRGVPTLVVGDTVLVGSEEIPARFPGIVGRGLAATGIDWPPVPELRPVLVQEKLLEAPAGGPVR